MSCWWSLAAVGNRGWMLIERRIRVGDIWELPFGLLSSSPLASSPPVILNVTSLIITHKIFPHWYLWKGKDKTARKFTRLLNIFLYSDLKTGGKGYFYFASLLNLRVPLQCLFLLHELFLSETTQRLGTLCCAFVNVSFEKNNCCHKLSGASAVVFFFVQRNNNKNKAHSSCAKSTRAAAAVFNAVSFRW